MSPQNQPLHPHGVPTPRAGHVTPLSSWQQDLAETYQTHVTRLLAPPLSPGVVGDKPGRCWSSGDPPQPHAGAAVVSPRAMPRPCPSQREPLGVVTAPQPPAAAPRVPVTTKGNISGWKLREGRHGNTAAGFHQNPGVRAQKDAQSPLPRAEAAADPAGVGARRVAPRDGVTPATLARGHPVGWRPWGHGDSRFCLVGAARGSRGDAAGCGAGGAVGTPPGGRMGTWGHRFGPALALPPE